MLRWPKVRYDTISAGAAINTIVMPLFGTLYSKLQSAVKRGLRSPRARTQNATPHTRYKNGTKLVQKWYKIGTQMVHKWYKIDTKLVQNWYKIGTQLVHNWYKVGTQLVHNWHTRCTIGTQRTQLVQTWHTRHKRYTIGTQLIGTQLNRNWVHNLVRVHTQQYFFL